MKRSWRLALAIACTALLLAGLILPFALPGADDGSMDLIRGYLRMAIPGGAGAQPIAPGVEGIGALLFNLMGLWPLAYLLLQAGDKRRWRPGPWPFCFASFAGGAFILLPWLLIREPSGERKPLPAPLRILSALVGLAAVAALMFSLSPAFDYAVFAQALRSSLLIKIMLVDFCLFWLLGALESRRFPPTARALAALPLIGAFIMPLFRALPDQIENQLR
ncbi:MAG TPA: hypothetical protein DCG47_02405 [Spirochaetaceae bacterium]|nr:hypothetical protein [Spirochaetaceae bacterium]